MEFLQNVISYTLTIYYHLIRDILLKRYSGRSEEGMDRLG